MRHPGQYDRPYDTNAMTLFDYRTDHFVEGSKELKDAETRPSFMYVMPEGPVKARTAYERSSRRHLWSAGMSAV